MTVIKSNGLLAREKGQALANDVLDAFSNTDCPEAQRAWFEEAVFDLVELPRLDSAIPGFVDELMPALSLVADIEAKVFEAECNGLLPAYQHIEGGTIAYCKASRRLMAWVSDENPSYCEILLGPQGLRQLASHLLNAAYQMEAGQ